MPDAMMNGGFAPYLAQAFTPQGVPGGVFGGGIGNVPGNLFQNPMLGQAYGQAGMFGNISPYTTNPQFGQLGQSFGGWQQAPLQQLSQPFGQSFGGWPQLGASWGQPFGGQPFGGWQQQPQQLGQPFGQYGAGGQEPVVLANLLRQYAVPISIALATPHGQAHIAQNIVQTAETLARVLPLVGAPQLTPLAYVLGQCAQPISAAIASSPYGLAHIAQNIARTAEIVERIVPLIVTQQLSQSMTQPYTGWQQMPQLGPTNALGQMSGQVGWPSGQHQLGQYLTQPYIGGQQQMPQFPANLLGQPYQPQLSQSFLQTPFGGMTGGGQYGQGQLGPFLGQSGDAVSRVLPFLAQQGLSGQGYGMARV